VPPPAVAELRSAFWPMSRAAILYSCVVAAGRQALGSGLHHRERSLRSETAAWARCAIRHLASRRRDAAAQDRLTSKSTKKYFILGLQVFDDLQVKHHAKSWTAETLLQAAMFIEAIESRQGLKVCCPEEIAFRSGYIDADQLERLATPLLKTGYGDYLLDLARGKA